MGAATAGMGALGSAVIAGAASGAVAGGLSSELIGGGFSWQAVGIGALSGAVGGGVGSLTANFGTTTGAIAGRIGVSSLAGGTTSWMASALSGHSSANAFFQGAEIAAIAVTAQIAVGYLTSPSVNADSQGSYGGYNGASSNQSTAYANNSFSLADASPSPSPNIPYVPWYRPGGNYIIDLYNGTMDYIHTQMPEMFPSPSPSPMPST